MTDIGLDFFGTTARILVGLTFMLSGLPKLLDQKSFAQAVSRFHLLPRRVLFLFALCIPVLELAVGAALLTGTFSRAGLLVALGMLAMFTGALSIALVRGMEGDCNCFGHLPIKQHGWAAIGRNLVLIGLSAVAIFGA